MRKSRGKKEEKKQIYSLCFSKIVFLLLKLSHVAELIRQEMKDAIRNGN